MPDITEEPITLDGREYVPGDLARYFNLGDDFGEDKWYEILGHNYNGVEREEYGTIVMLYKSNNEDYRTIMLIGDSFAGSMRVYIGSQFSEAKFVNWMYFDNNMVKDCKPDIFVYESVERAAVAHLKVFRYE